MDYGPYEQIAVDLEDGILTLTLNRPDKLNAFTGIMRGEMVDLFTRVNEDDEARVVIVTGAGRGFCAGADLSAGGDTFNYEKTRPEEVAEAAKGWRDGGGRVSLSIFNCLKPVIAAVNGPAVGVGATMQLPMDVRLASQDAKFGFVFSRRGILPEACSSWFLPRVVGISRAMEWVATGRIFDAAEALEAGLVRAVHPPEALLPAARTLAREMTETTAPVSVAMARQMLWRMLGADHPMAAHRVDSRGIFEMGRAGDVREGVESFLEKRPPRFPGRVSKDMPPFYPWFEEPEF